MESQLRWLISGSQNIPCRTPGTFPKNHQNTQIQKNHHSIHVWNIYILYTFGWFFGMINASKYPTNPMAIPPLTYGWWKKSCTTWNVSKPCKHGIFWYSPYQPAQDFFHQQYVKLRVLFQPPWEPKHRLLTTELNLGFGPSVPSCIRGYKRRATVHTSKKHPMATAQTSRDLWPSPVFVGVCVCVLYQIVELISSDSFQ